MAGGKNLPLLQFMRLSIVALPTDALKVAPLCPQRVIRSIKWNDMVNLSCCCIATHLTYGPLLSHHAAYTCPVLIIAPLLIGASCCINSRFASCSAECRRAPCHQTSTPCTRICTSSASVLPVLFKNLTVIVLHPLPTVPPVNVKEIPLFAAIT